jgi:hypothetical protein
MKKLISLFTVFTVMTLLQSCGSSKPSSFVKATDGGTWTSVFVREELTYEKTFNEVLDIIAKRFEMDMINKDGGYGRTNWVYTWNDKGKYTEKYRTRVIFKFSADRSKVDIKTEAEFGGEPNWIKGFDSRLLSTVKQDVMGVVGRTTM